MARVHRRGIPGGVPLAFPTSVSGTLIVLENGRGIPGGVGVPLVFPTHKVLQSILEYLCAGFRAFPRPRMIPPVSRDCPL
jgi:hypothetical protein